MSNRRRPTSSGDAVTVAYIGHNDVAFSWHHSMVQMIGYDLANGRKIMRGGYIAMRCGTGNLVQARNQAVEEFLTSRNGDWLFWIDTDMGFTPDTVDRLLAVADRDNRPVVGGLCFAQREMTGDGMGGFRCLAGPTIFDWVRTPVPDGAPEGTEPQQGFAMRFDYMTDAVVKCAGTGSACILIHRSVLEQIREAYGPVWYNRLPNPTVGELVSEDLSFCMRLGAMGIPLYVHTGVKTSHQKTLWLAEDEYVRQRAIVELAVHFQTVQAAADEAAVAG